MAHDKALAALDRIAGDDEWRRAFIRQLLALEAAIKAPGVDVREEITGPLATRCSTTIRWSANLSNGVTFRVPLPVEDRARLRHVAA